MSCILQSIIYLSDKFYEENCHTLLRLTNSRLIWSSLVTSCVSKEVADYITKSSFLYFLSNILIKSFGCRFLRFSMEYFTILMVSGFHIRSCRKWICLPIPLIQRLPLRDFLTCVYLYVRLPVCTDRNTLRPKLLLTDSLVLNLWSIDIVS